MFSSFFSYISKAADELKKIDDPIRVISHLDADGITSAAITLQALKRLGKKYHLSIVKQLNEEVLIELMKEDYKVFLFTDLGCGQIENIKKYIHQKVFILDHHSFDLTIEIPGNLIVINPHMHNIDGSKDISGAGVSYFFAKALNEKNSDLAYLAIIGAIGDVQENEGFSEIGTKILEDAKNIRIEKGLKWFGLETKSIIKLLTFSEDVFVPGISGNESNAIQFLLDLGIEPKKGDEWKNYHDLSEDEKKKLVAGILMKRNGSDKASDIFRSLYIIENEKNGPFRECREYATLLNACGRLDKATLAVAACMGDENSKKEALSVLELYRNEIISAMRWYDKNRNSDRIIHDDKYMILNARDEIKPTIIGTLASIVSNNKEIKQGTIIISMAYDSEKIKISSRINGETDMDLRLVIQKILAEINGGEGGGHKNAAGAIIDKKDEEKFVEAAKKELSNIF